MIALLLSGCTEEKIVSPEAELVKTRVDLQQGFEGKWVQVQFNGEHCFQAGISTMVSLSGPLAHFTTYLTRGTNRLSVTCRPLDFQGETFTDSSDVEIGDSEEYFIGIRVWNDTLHVQVQDSTFLYI